METIEKYINKGNFDKLFDYIMNKKDRYNLKKILNLKMKGLPLLHRVDLTNFKSEIIDLLIVHGLEINDTDDLYGSTILMKSIEDNNEKLFLYLLRTSADLNLQDKRGQSALHYSCYNLNYIFIDYLLKFNANPNIQDNFGCTPLMMLAYGISHQLFSCKEKQELEIKIVELFFKNSNGTGFRDPALITGTGIYEFDPTIKNKEGLLFSDIVELHNKNLLKYFKLKGEL